MKDSLIEQRNTKETLLDKLNVTLSNNNLNPADNIKDAYETILENKIKLDYVATYHHAFVEFYNTNNDPIYDLLKDTARRTYNQVRRNDNGFDVNEPVYYDKIKYKLHELAHDSNNKPYVFLKHYNSKGGIGDYLKQENGEKKKIFLSDPLLEPYLENVILCDCLDDASQCKKKYAKKNI